MLAENEEEELHLYPHFQVLSLLTLCGDLYVANQQHGKTQIHWQRHSSFAFKSIASPCKQRVIGKKGFETIFSYAKFSNVFFAALFPRTIYNSENVFHFLCVEQNNVCRKDGQNFYNKQVDASGKKGVSRRDLIPRKMP